MDIGRLDVSTFRDLVNLEKHSLAKSYKRKHASPNAWHGTFVIILIEYIRLRCRLVHVI